MLFPSENPIPDKTYAHQYCASIFTDFSSRMMNSCSCWKIARSGAQTTARGHPNLACGNSARPMMRLSDDTRKEIVSVCSALGPTHWDIRT
jgi:hypothetical protein